MRCASCRGSKKVMSIGAMLVECSVCKGVGTVVDSEKVKEAVTEAVSVDSEVKADDKASEVKTERPAVKRKYKRKSVG